MRMTIVLGMAAALCFAGLGVVTADEPATAYDATKFTISYWCGPPAEELTVERFQEIKEANFTLAFPPCSGMTVEQNRKMLDLCQKVGIQGVVGDSRMVHSLGGADAKANLDAIVKDYADHPALLGYHVADEPGAGAFGALADVMAYLKEKDPKHPGYINLLPTHALPTGALGVPTYEEYVRSFAAKVRPFVLSYDHYPFTISGDRPSFFENLATVRAVSLETGIPFWNIVLVTQHFDYRRLTEPELRYEAMQTLAFGARGLLWFTYWMPPGVPSPETWKHSLIGADGTRDPHYAMVKAINADAKAIGDALGNSRSVAVFHHGEGATIERGKESPIVPSEGKLTVGVFAGDGARHWALVTNRDYTQSTQTRVTISPPGVSIEAFDPARQSWSPATLDGPGVVPLDLPAGGGMLLRW